jgi:putative transposase
VDDFEGVGTRPVKPIDNAFVETLNGSFRDECLNLHWLDDLTEAKHLSKG